MAPHLSSPQGSYGEVLQIPEVYPSPAETFCCILCVCVRVEGGIHLPLALVFFRSSGGLDVFFRRGVIALREKPNYVSTLAVEPDEFKGNRAHLRPAQWLKDIKQTERRDQY